jgi:hypothetical protein
MPDRVRALLRAMPLWVMPHSELERLGAAPGCGDAGRHIISILAPLGTGRTGHKVFRFSTTEQKWDEQNGSIPPGSHEMAAVGSNLYVFGDSSPSTKGEEGTRAAGNRLGACQIERGHSLRAMPLCLPPNPVLEQRDNSRAAPGSGDAGRHITSILAPGSTPDDH